MFISVSLCPCISVKAQMDALCNGAMKPEGCDPPVDPRPPPAKLARLEQNGAGPSAQERSGQGSPVAKNPSLAHKPNTVRPQSKSWHSRGRFFIEKDFFNYTNWQHFIAEGVFSTVIMTPTCHLICLITDFGSLGRLKCYFY